VVVPDEIRKYCKKKNSASGPRVLQREKDSVEESGLVKIDILGNLSLAVIRDALEMVEEDVGATNITVKWIRFLDKYKVSQKIIST